MATKKQQTHDRIVRTAARAIRRDGYAGTSVADVMAEAGLTHGGFYSHFASRDAMLAEALDHAAGDALAALEGGAAHEPDALAALVAGYLSDAHVDATETGCTIAALGSETRRQTPEVRRVATRRIKEMAELVERTLPGRPSAQRREDALAIMATLVGAVLIARVVDDPATAKAVRKAAARVARPT